VRRKGGKFTKSQDQFRRSLAADRRKRAKTKVKSGEAIDSKDMAKQQNIPHIENVDLVPETKTPGAAPGFTLDFAFVVSVALILGALLFYSLLA
jgi:hypothetical protein